MSHEKLLLVKGIIIGTALIGYKVAVFRAIHKKISLETDQKKQLKDNKEKEK